MSLRTVALLLVASAGASRIQVHEVDEAEHRAKFGASCDHLQTVFRSRVGAFQVAFDAIDEPEAISRATQARLMMRTYGIVRTMRRARTCQWVTDDNSEDIEQARGIVQALLAGNPCADVARSELEAGASADTAEVEIRSIQRAMWVLTSDSCELVEPEGEIREADESAALEELQEAEDRVQDAIDELAEPSQEGVGAFIETDQSSVRRFFRALGVALLMLFLALACTGAVAFIGLALGVLLAGLNAPLGADGWHAVFMGLYGFGAGAALGLGPCVYQLYTQLLPRLTN